MTGLYKAFASYPQPERIEACPCGCTEPGATQPLVATTLPQLSLHDLASYSFSAITTQGTVDDFRYLLPRLFEGVTEEGFGYDPEVLSGKLRYARWMTWPSHEVLAVRSYLHALWRNALKSFPLQSSMPAFADIEQVLDSVAQTGEDLRLYLAALSSVDQESADRHLIQFVTMHGADFDDGHTLEHGFWQESKQAAESLRSWLLQPSTLERVRRGAHYLADDGFDHLFAPALSMLQREAGVPSS